jgi:2,4-dienoyl-CoA reductase-like NADH-dependent reductase (Old Yellow Enzyme family)
VPPAARLVPAVDRGSYLSPLVRNGARKWGLGVYRDSNRVADLLRQTQPGVIMLMDPTIGWARRVRAAHPDAFIVGRRFQPDSEQRLDRPEERGVAFADWVAELAVPLRGVVDGWVSYNEPIGTADAAAYGAYNRFQLAFARRLQYTHGVAAVAGNEGPGALQPDDYPRYFAEAIVESEFLGLHVYAPSRRPAMRWDAEWHALRYRKIHEALELAGIRGKRIVITESGLADGYRADGMTDEETAEGLVWFTRELQRDPYVIGHATFGLFDATGAWPQHDLTDSAVPDLVPRLLDRLP